jgi:copper chaperone CopZ
MKTKLFSMLGLGLFLAVSCRQHDFRELTLHVPEMQNQACVQIVMQALSRGPGIVPNSVLLDPEKRVIRLTYDSLLSADKNFEYLVSKAGFAVNGIPADEKARAALPPDARL